MRVLIALLRGINVGGCNKLAMKDLRSIVEALGASDVSTYIQSGNVVFRTTKTASAFEKKLKPAIEAQAGFAPEVIALDLPSLRTVIENNPFDMSDRDPSRLYITFLKANADKGKLRDVEKRLSSGEQVAAIGAAVYFDAPDGVARSKAAEALGRAYPGGTTRNWRTCLKLEEMAAALS